jgi:hypothetical protein
MVHYMPNPLPSTVFPITISQSLSHKTPYKYAIDEALLNKRRTEDHCLLGCEAVKSCGSLLMFQKNTLPQFSCSKNNKPRKQTSKQHG